MAAHSPPAISADLVAELLNQPTIERQSAILRAAGLLNEASLSGLLDQAMRLARGDPGRARDIAVLCAAAAEEAGAPAIYPRAAYLQAQVHAANGEFERARDQIVAARQAYELLGNSMEALRTNIGLMHVLNESGQAEAALQAGLEVLTALEGPAGSDPRAPMLAALAHQNRGVCFETGGRYDEALAAYTRAADLFTGLGQDERLGDLHNNRGIVLVHLGRTSEALEAFKAAARIWEAAGLALLHGQTLSNQGDALLAQGRYTQSLEAYERARRLLEPLDAVAHRRILLRKMADAYLALNLYPEALDAYREVAGLLKAAGMADHYARAAWGTGAALLAEGDAVGAAGALSEAAQHFAGAGNLPMWSSVMLEQSAQRHAVGETVAAVDLALSALKLVRPASPAERGNWPVQAAYAALRVADLMLPDTSAASPYLDEARGYAEDLSLPAINFRLHSRLGRLHLLQHSEAEARQHLEMAVALIEDARGQLSHESLRTSFLRDKHSPYADLLRLQLDSSPAGEGPEAQTAFELAERAKSRSLVDTLTGMTAPPAAGNADLAAQISRLQADLDAAYNRFLDPGEPALAELQAHASRLERELHRLTLRGSASPAQAGASSLNPFAHVLSPGWLRDHLPAGLPFVAYHSLGDEILAFVVGSGGTRVIRAVSRVSTVRQLLQQLSAQWDRFRAGREFAQRHMATLEKSVQRILAALYAELWAPLEQALEREAPGERLAIVPHGLLHQVPFHALHGHDQYLIDRYEISYAPSATILALCEQQAPTRRSRALVMGVADDLIASVAEEAQEVAETLASVGLDVQLATNETATPATFSQHAPTSDIIHLACHGLFRADNPMYSSLRLQSGWLTAASVAGQRLPNSLVTLSACESGRGRVLAGDEVIGLPRAFLGAGASSVLVSLWLVHDETTAELMMDWYRRLMAPAATSGPGKMGPAAALRAAQQAMRVAYPHPYFWAPFVLMGKT